MEKKQQDSDDAASTSAPFLSNLHGTVSYQGNMTHFFAENLQDKIRLSNQENNTKPENTKISEWNLNCAIISELEIESQYIAASVDQIIENLCNLLHSTSSITADHVESFKVSVKKLTDCMDANIKSMYTILAKSEEITNTMKLSEKLAIRIKDIRRLVDLLELNL